MQKLIGFATAGFVLVLIFIASCSERDGGKLTDSRDGKKYKIVNINNQTWMAENLAHEFGNSKCYNNEPENCEKYGRLYNFNEAKIACPKGWHLPSHEEWQTLISYVEDETSGAKLKAKSGWNDEEGKSGNGTDEFGFSALPGGDGISDGSFFLVGSDGFWWGSSEYSGCAYFRIVSRYNEGLLKYDDDCGRLLFSVRCVQD